MRSIIFILSNFYRSWQMNGFCTITKKTLVVLIPRIVRNKNEWHEYRYAIIIIMHERESFYFVTTYQRPFGVLVFVVWFQNNLKSHYIETSARTIIFKKFPFRFRAVSLNILCLEINRHNPFKTSCVGSKWISDTLYSSFFLPWRQ